MWSHALDDDDDDDDGVKWRDPSKKNKRVLID